MNGDLEALRKNGNSQKIKLSNATVFRNSIMNIRNSILR